MILKMIFAYRRVGDGVAGHMDELLGGSEGWEMRKHRRGWGDRGSSNRYFLVVPNGGERR
jgi:hypothetical protein